MTSETRIVHDEWNSYPTSWDGVMMFVSFDAALAREEPPEELQFCARVMIPIRTPNDAGGPVSPESELLWEMEDALVAQLQKDSVRCRLVARLTYNGVREVVFQLHDWDSFRPPVGLWIMQHQDYEIDVSEHDVWGFYEDCIRPRVEDQILMADRSVVDSLIENGSDPEKEHSLEFVFVGSPDGLSRVATALQDRGYDPVGKIDISSGQIVLARKLVLDLSLIVDESLSHHALAEEAEIEFDGWGAAIVK